MTLNAEDTLELTLTQAVMDSYQATQEVVSDVSFVAAEPQSLQDVIRSDEDNPNPGGEAIYWLQNLTDMPLEFWSRGPRQSERPLPVVFEPSDLGQPSLQHGFNHAHSGPVFALTDDTICRINAAHVTQQSCAAFIELGAV